MHWRRRSLLHAYFTGLFDGEGSIYIAKPAANKLGYSLGINLKQKSGFTEVLKEMESLYGGHVHYRADKSGADWTAYGKTAFNFLKLAKYYSRIKKEQIETALKYFKKFGKGRLRHKTGIIRKRTLNEMTEQETYRLLLQQLKRK